LSVMTAEPDHPAYCALVPEIAPLEARLPILSGDERLDALVTLAWHLRQRDTRQALTLADYAAQMTQEPNDPDPRARRRAARLALVRAEAAALNGDGDAAEGHLAVARPIYEALADDLGMGDVWATAAVNAWGRSHFLVEMECWSAALESYARADDVIRRDHAATRVELWRVQRSRKRAGEGPLGAAPPGSARGDGEVPSANDHERSDHPCVSALRLAIQGYRYEGSNDPARKVVAFARASRLAAEAGLIRLAIVAAVRAALGFLEMGDEEAAATWSDQAYGLARPTGWPNALAKCHIVFGSLLHSVGELERSREVFVEALPLAGRNAPQCQWGLARALLDLGSVAEALDLLTEAAAAADSFDDAVMFCGIEVERARALILLGRPVEAVEQIDRARARAAVEGIKAYDVAFHETLADAFGEGGAPPPAGLDAARARLSFLTQAAEAGAAQPRWEPSPTLLLKTARARAAVGDLAEAVTLYERSIAANDRDLARRVRDRIAAAQAREEIERARREAEEQQKLALAESSRANDLQAMIDTMRQTQEALARRTEELERLSMLDALTGVPNRRHLDERVTAEMALMKRKSTLLALALFALDHFKMVNDTYGHAAGDIVLKTVAETARGLLRPSDFIARVGGEEFTLLLPRTSIQGAATIADRIRQALMALNIVYAEFRIPVTASFGVTLIAESETDATEAMNRADTALYRAKRDGRNMVRIEAI